MHCIKNTLKVTSVGLWVVHIFGICDLKCSNAYKFCFIIVGSNVSCLESYFVQYISVEKRYVHHNAVSHGIVFAGSNYSSTRIFHVQGRYCSFYEYDTQSISVIFYYPKSGRFPLKFVVLCYCGLDLAFQCKKQGGGKGPEMEGPRCRV